MILLFYGVKIVNILQKAEKIMIYRKTIEPKCRLCKHATLLENSGNIMCDIHGSRPKDFACKKYSYDIFKREIKPKPKMKQFKPSDFEI